MSKEKVYAKFEIEKGKKRDLREKDVKDDETGEWYRIRELSALKRLRISDASVMYAPIDEKIKTGNLKLVDPAVDPAMMEPKVDTEKLQILTIKYGVIQPDLSKQTTGEIEQWLDTISPNLFTKLLSGITKLSSSDMKALQNLRGTELKKNPLPQLSSS